MQHEDALGLLVHTRGEAATHLLLIRHGQSEWNLSGRRQGQADPPLSALGLRQAAAAARSIGYVDGVVSSDLRRAAETAAIIAGKLDAGPVEADERLRERDAGEWTGLTRAEIEQHWPGWPDSNRRPTGFESASSVVSRVLQAFSEIYASKPGQLLLVVTHGGVIRRLEKSQGICRPHVAHLGGLVVHLSRSGAEVGERIALLDSETDVGQEDQS